MSDEQALADETAWRPANSAHAIQNVFAGIVFSQPLTSVVLKRALDSGRALATRQGWPEEVPVQSFSFVMSPFPPTGPMPTQGAGAEFLKRTSIGSPAEKLTLDPASLRLDTWAYIRWIGFEEKLAETLNALLPIYTGAVVMRALSLEYTDVFIATAPGDADSRLIIDEASDCLARTPIQRSRQWHSHTGWFENETEQTRSLLNTDVTVGDANTNEGVRRSITIRTHHSFQFLPTSAGDEESQLLSVDDVLSKFGDLHVDLKHRLGSLLTPVAKQMISL